MGDNEEEVLCPICYCDVPKSSLADLGCGHAYCGDCWIHFISDSLKDAEDTGKLLVFCPGPDCTKFIRKDFILRYGDDATRTKYCDLLDKMEVRPVPGLVELYKDASGDDFEAVTAGPTDYYHYECNTEADTGWGCSYRCAQMILNNLRQRGAPGVRDGKAMELEPSVFDIQMDLATVDTGGYFGMQDIGSSKWIGPSEVEPLLKLFGVQNAHMSEEIMDDERRADLCGRLWAHFSTGGPPVMFDNGKKSYCVVGARRPAGKAFDAATGEVLLMDPHHGERVSTDDFKTALAQGGLAEVPLPPSLRKDHGGDDVVAVAGLTAKEREFMKVEGGENEAAAAAERKQILLAHGVRWIPFDGIFGLAPYWQALWVSPQ